MENKNIWICLALIAVIAITALFFPKQVIQFGASATEGFKEFTIFENLKTGSFWATATLTVDSEFRIGNKFYYPIGGTCTDQSPTLFNIANPLGATSTLVNFKIEGRNGGSTTVLQVGTTSIATLLGGSLPAPYVAPLVNAIGIGTSSYFWIEAGITNNIIGGQATSSGAGTVSRLTIGPDDRLYGRATSTSQNQAKSGDFTLNSLTDATNTFNCTWEALLER